ncbi:putative O-glycosylation ligase, exosortase A system-associated [Siccirubricoccus sp. G192]|uniref:putative O-glycosylation ligase, exosortase A system-associated n=1 Tax=Siccirubricoccus sp. G192 TaxID=2849651 RepID=UPI001C2BA5D6|nr:putative O-glycosylation ligase, exosortase A system-associated [Siccirubricoccus sp. G192]MBV1799979.1 putative O-glycosylation ligase, exosortase A system-associated [Siccirubricoccus sp. G192]
MLRSLYVVLVYLAFLALGVVAPFVFSLGYVWVDTFNPQRIDYIMLPLFPVSLVMGAGAVGGYILLDRRSPPPISLFMVLTLALAIWVTLTTAFLAVAPDAAWAKWDWASKTILFSAFFPFIFRSRIQIEAFLQVYIFSLTIHFVSAAIKTIFSGGGYGRVLSVAATSGDYGLAEGSTLAAVALMVVPIIFFLRAHTRILPKSILTDALYAGLVAAAIIGAIGTYARTGLIGMVVVGVAMWIRTSRKITFGIIGAVAAAAVIYLTSDAWNERISTIQDYDQESSALGRILAWKWTLQFVASNPLGGGFDAYRINQIVFPATELHPEPLVVYGKAFHSIYFEVLGEHGWIGLGLFLGLVATTFLTQQVVVRRTRKVKELEWCRELALALQVSLLTMLACGAFIGIAFQPMFYYLFAISSCLGLHVRRALKSMAESEASARVARPGARWIEAPSIRRLAATAEGAVRRKPAGRTWREQP